MNDMIPTPDPGSTGQILEELRPRMRAARLSHLRRVVAGVALVPLVGIGAYAVAAAGPTSTSLETADGSADRFESDTATPPAEIGDGADADREADEADGRDEADDVVVTDVPTTTTLAPDAPRWIETGVLGAIEVAYTDAGIEVVDYDLVIGWEVLGITEDDGVLRILVGDGDTLRLIKVATGIRDELLVTVDEVAFPTTTTTVKPEPAPAPAPVVDRIVVEVPGKGSFVVERDGEMLFVGNVTVEAGYEYDIIRAEGWKVWVGFFTADHVWYGKALINDLGQIEQHVWDEAIGPQPVYQWVEIPGVGAAKFEVLEGQIRVIKTEVAVGFGAWDYNQGAAAATAKVDFEGEGQIWFIDAWVTDTGELGWESYQG